VYPHCIRLRGPWDVESLSGDAPPRRVTMPCRGADLGFAGQVRCRRSFGLPRQIDPHERVWLVFEGAGAVREIVLNEQPLVLTGEESGKFEFEVTPLLVRRNQLQVVAEASTSETLLWDEIFLEIRCTAFVRGVRIWTETSADHSRLHAAGEVIGHAEQPLEVYLLENNRTVGYASVVAGQPFEVISESRGAESRTSGGSIRVDLVCGAVIWYTIEVPV
jgi:hypothetical protein